MSYQESLRYIIALSLLTQSCTPLEAKTQVSIQPNESPNTLLDPTIAPRPTIHPTNTPEIAPLLSTATRVQILPFPKETEVFDYDKIIEEMSRKYSRSFTDIPEALRRGNPSFHPYFNNIPEIMDLRKKLEESSGSEKWEHVAQIIGLIGVQTKEEISDLKKATNILFKWNYLDSSGDRVLTCNTYSTTLLRALGLESDISHWFDADGVPQFNSGREYQAADTLEWLNNIGAQYNWTDVSGLNIEDRMDMLKKGYIILGANDNHMWIILSSGNEGMPIITQSMPNTLFGKPSTRRFSNPSPGTLFAHPLPGENVYP